MKSWCNLVTLLYFVMDYRNKIFTVILDSSNLKSELNEIIDLIENNGIINVEILFGWSWGNDYKNWTPFVVDVKEICKEINKVEELRIGNFGDNDFFIALKDLEIEILFCHESDIHLSFNYQNAITLEIINSWSLKKIINYN